MFEGTMKNYLNCSLSRCFVSFWSNTHFSRT